MRVARTTDNSPRVVEPRELSEMTRARAYCYTAVTALRADLARITRSTRLLYRSETPVLKFVVSGPVRSDVSLNASVRVSHEYERASERRG